MDSDLVITRDSYTGKTIIDGGVKTDWVGAGVQFVACVALVHGGYAAASALAPSVSVLGNSSSIIEESVPALYNSAN